MPICSFAFRISCDSSAEQIEQANQIVREAIEAQSDTCFDRVHFKEFAASALNFEAVFYMLDPAFSRYMDVQQAINIQMLRAFAKAGIEFAFPTQTLHVASLPAALAPRPQDTVEGAQR